MKKLCVLLALISTTCGSLIAIDQLDLKLGDKNKAIQAKKPGSYSIDINNRPLTNINGRTISVMDLVKRLDFIMQNQMPKNTPNSVITKYQFYQEYWPIILKEMADNYLVLADAEDKKLPINNGEIRQELENTFGSNPIKKVNEIGWSFQEARKFMKENIAVRRMLYVQTEVQIDSKVTPKDIKSAYRQFAKENTPKTIITYQTLAINGEDQQKVTALANSAHDLLKTKKTPIKDIITKLNEVQNIDDTIKITLSDKYVRDEEEISTIHKEVLNTLSINNYSSPKIQQNKKKLSTTICRIFFLEDKKEQKTPSFKEMEPILRQNLTQNAIIKEKEKYLSKLRTHYKVPKHYLSERLPPNFAPFILTS